METLTIKTETKGDVAVVTVSGRIDSESAPALDAELTKITGSTSKLVVDLKGVEFMSSAGLRVAIKASQAAEKKWRFRQTRIRPRGNHFSYVHCRS